MYLLFFERSAFMLSFLLNKQLLFTAAKENAYYKHQSPSKIKETIQTKLKPTVKQSISMVKSDFQTMATTFKQHFRC